MSDQNDSKITKKKKSNKRNDTKILKRHYLENETKWYETTLIDIKKQ